MSDDHSIIVERLSKCYHIYDHPRDRLRQALSSRLRRLVHSRSHRQYYREFWALRDVSFDVRRGEAVGIIGRNGAGKSTLLQIIAGTLTPTSGDMQVHGRVAALLELGSGFNPEFTGRENVHLNAEVMGLEPAEVDRRFDGIAAFADIGDFIDQPVKAYSSGMLMRLAFALQTAVSPDVLIVDEALAVGDVFFRARCMTRLNQLIDGGVTVLFVSHDPGVVRQLCSRALLLDRGQSRAFGPTGAVGDLYLQMELNERNQAAPPRGRSTDPVLAVNAEVPADVMAGSGQFQERAALHRSGNRQAEFINVQMLKDGLPADTYEFGDTVVLRQVIRLPFETDNLNIVYKIRTLHGVDVVFSDTRLAGEAARRYGPGVHIVDWTFQVRLMHGAYTIMAALSHPPTSTGEDWTFFDVIPVAFTFRVLPRAEGMIDGLVAADNTLTIADTSLPA